MKYLDKNGLMYLLELVRKANIQKTNEDVKNAVLEAVLPSDEDIIARINALTNNGSVASKKELLDNVSLLKRMIKEAQEDAVNDAISKMNARIYGLVRQYVYEVADSIIQSRIQSAIDSAIAQDKGYLTRAEADALYLGKAAISGDLSVKSITATGNIKANKFITAAGNQLY